MPVCKKCGKPFPNHIVIDGKSKNLQNRQYCLECYPFNNHNTKQLEAPEPDPHHICKECGKEFIYHAASGQYSDLCSTCVSKKRRKERKAIAIAYKGGKCSKCGYDACQEALEFHHRDPSSKEFSISGFITCSLDKLLAELDKCDLLCANCHREAHYNAIRGSNSTVES